MENFPQLTNWFRFIEKEELGDEVTIEDGYYNYNECSFFTLLWKNGVNHDDFVKEFVKLISRIRGSDVIKISGGEVIDFSEEFINFFDTGKCNLNQNQKLDYIDRIMSHGMRSQEGTFDLEGTRGHFGEILYYLLRIQFLKDDKIDISSNIPKRYSKEPGLDFTEIRKDKEGFYLIIGEVKSTKNTIGNYPDKIVSQLNSRHKTTFLEHHSFYRDKITTGFFSEAGLIKFIGELSNFSSISSLDFKSDKKRFTGVINYGRNNLHTKTVFGNFQNKTKDTLANEIKCRKVKLIGINNIDEIVKKIYDSIFIDFLK